MPKLFSELRISDEEIERLRAGRDEPARCSLCLEAPQEGEWAGQYAAPWGGDRVVFCDGCQGWVDEEAMSRAHKALREHLAKSLHRWRLVKARRERSVGLARDGGLEIASVVVEELASALEALENA